MPKLATLSHPEERVEHGPKKMPRGATRGMQRSMRYVECSKSAGSSQASMRTANIILVRGTGANHVVNGQPFVVL
jgi:hypothetical protein